MSKTLKKRAARLEREARGRAERIRITMRDYRENLLRGRDLTSGPSFEKHLERAIGDYINLQKRLRRINRRMRTKNPSR